MLGIPLFMGYYFGGNNDEGDRGMGGGGVFDGLDPFNF